MIARTPLGDPSLAGAHCGVRCLASASVNYNLFYYLAINRKRDRITKDICRVTNDMSSDSIVLQSCTIARAISQRSRIFGNKIAHSASSKFRLLTRRRRKADVRETFGQ